MGSALVKGKAIQVLQVLKIMSITLHHSCITAGELRELEVLETDDRDVLRGMGVEDDRGVKVAEVYGCD